MTIWCYCIVCILCVHIKTILLCRMCSLSYLISSSKYVTIYCSFFFFSSRRRHTRSLRDWSSDVWSSDLAKPGHHLLGERLLVADVAGQDHLGPGRRRGVQQVLVGVAAGDAVGLGVELDGRGAERRSEERRVGKSVDLGGRRIIKKKREK